ncbi:MAG: autotransporter-associated beta strand repeat-containing protein [Candidatus Methylacidiphilales bacterium]|nr:autotransporter-associated beta strand repeat-containing protein [Candidatus Methylacidiphilales bacterium]
MKQPIYPTAKRTILFALLACSLTHLSLAGNTWTGDGANANWSDNNNWGGAAPVYGNLTFTTGGTQGTTSTNNNITSMNSLIWTGSSSWVMNGNVTLSLFDNGGAPSKIENQSTGSVTINAPITFAANNGAPPNPFGEINAVNGNITFSGGTLTINGASVNGIKFWGGSGRDVTFANTVAASGKWLATTGSASITIASGANVTAANVYIMNGGTLNLSGGTLTNNSTTGIRLGGDFGTTTNQNQTQGGTLALTPLSGGVTFGSLINSVAGNTSNNLVIDSRNTSGNNSLTGGVFLDSDLRIQQAAGGNLTFSGGTFDIKNRSLTINAAAGGTVTIAQALTSTLGAGGTLVKQGNGTLILSSTSNTYTGTTSSTLNATGTQINGGVLAISGDTSLGLAPTGAYNNIQFTGNGTLRDQTTNITLNANRNILVNSGVVGTLDNNGNTFAVNGVVNGGGGLNITGNSTGQVTLAGNSTYSGGTTVGATRLAVGISSTANATNGILAGATGTGNLTLNDGATLIASGGSRDLFAGRIDLGGNITIGTGPSSNRLQVGGQWDLGNTTRTITLTKNASGFGSGQEGLRLIQITGGATPVVGNGTLSIQTTSSGGNYSVFTIGATTNFTNNAGLIIGSNVATTFGTGTPFGSGTNAPALTVQTGGIFNMADGGGATRSIEIYSLSGGGNVTTLNGNTTATGTLTINNGNSQTYSGQISNGSNSTVAITKTGAGTQTFSGVNTYTGNTTINGGTLALSGSGSIANSTHVNANAGFDISGLSGASTSVNSLSGNSTGSIVLGSKNLTLGAGNSTGASFAGVISGSGGSVTKNGAGNLTLTGSNSYTGATQINGGTVVLSGNGALSSATDVTNNSGFNISGISASSTSIGSLAGSGNVTLGGKTLQVGGNNASTVFSGALNGSGGGLTKAGNGTFTLSGSNGYTGATSVNGGTLLIDSTGTINGTSGVAVNTGAVFRYNSSTTYTGGAISNNGGSVTGSGNLGALTLGGNGSVDPGNSPGILTAANTNPTGGLDYNFEFTATGAPTWSNATGSVNDVLRLTTGFTADLGAGNAVNIYLAVSSLGNGDIFQGGFFTDNSADFLSSIQNGTYAFYVQGDNGGSNTYNGVNYYTLAQYNALVSGSYTLDLSTVQVSSANFSGGTVSNGYVMQFSTIPEPSTYVMLAGGLISLMVLRRRARKS